MKDYTLPEITQVFQSIHAELHKAIQGQNDLIDHLLIGLFSEGHILIEGVPGLGKTLLINALCLILGAKFKRIQFTPDLMPSDIIGTTVFNSETSKFQVKIGPVFTNLLLADEINRAPAKTQSALLQAMQERTVNIDGVDYPLGDFFICFATQNPIEMEGTYPLPEAQKDRFLMKLFIDYPSLEEEQEILKAYRSGFTADRIQSAGLRQIISIEELLAIKEYTKTVTVDDKIISYITNIVAATRGFTGIEVGSSPRGSVALFQTARIRALVNGRNFVTPDDVKDMVLPALRHRIIIDPEAEIEGEKADDFLQRIIEKIEVPR
ncbi:MAG TPA: MoxR family ATPase [Bacillota bacterium]|nr:MoxR family ATPase [Bacillota bacterium]